MRSYLAVRLGLLLCAFACCTPDEGPTETPPPTLPGASVLVQGELTWMGEPLPALENRGKIIFQDPVSRETRSVSLEPEGAARFQLNVSPGVEYEVWWQRGGSALATGPSDLLPFGHQLLTERTFDRSETLKLNLKGRAITLTGTISDEALNGWLHIAFGSTAEAATIYLGTHTVGHSFSLPLLAGTYSPWAAHVDGGALPLCPAEGCAFDEDGTFAFTLPRTGPADAPKGALTGTVTLQSPALRTLRGATIKASPLPPRVGQPPSAWLRRSHFAPLTEAGTFELPGVDQGVYLLSLQGPGADSVNGRYQFPAPAVVTDQPGSWQGQATSKHVTFRIKRNGADLPRLPVETEGRAAQLQSANSGLALSLPPGGPWVQTLEVLSGTYALSIVTEASVGRTHIRALRQNVLPTGSMELAPFTITDAPGSPRVHDVVFDLEVSTLRFSFAESFATAVGGKETVLVLYDTQDHGMVWHANLLARQGEMLVYRGCYLPMLWRVHAGQSEPQDVDLLQADARHAGIHHSDDVVPLSPTPLCVDGRDARVIWTP